MMRACRVTEFVCSRLAVIGCMLAVSGPCLFAQSAWESADELPVGTVELALPTKNNALYNGGGSAFYQYTDRRMVPGVAEAWEGGRYGFVRNFRRFRNGDVYQRFHEGIDIRSVDRSSEAAEPRDRVRAIDKGIVVYANTNPQRSTYGLYVVVEHWWDGSPFYSLSAHLKSISVQAGQVVERGDDLGALGYTGRGINRRRAHLHLEVNLMLSRGFDQWYQSQPDLTVPNRHGIYNGVNLAGMDVAALYLESQENVDFSIRQFLADHEPFYAVIAPSQGIPDMLWRYPWMSPQLAGWDPMFGPVADLGASWRIVFARSGLPLRFEAILDPVEGPIVEILQQGPIPYQHMTSGRVRGTGQNAVLTRSGQRYLDLVLRTSPELRSDLE